MGFDEETPLPENNTPQKNSLNFNQEDSQSVEISSQENHIENNISGESFNESKQEVQIENSPQITKEDNRASKHISKSGWKHFKRASKPQNRE